MTNSIVGWHHAWSLRPHSRCAEDRRKEVCCHPHPRYHRPATPGLVDPKLDRKCGGCLLTGFTARPSLSMRANHLFTSDASPHSDDGNRIHWRRRLFRRCGRTVYDWYPCAGVWHLGSPPCLRWHVCGHAGLLVRTT
jgi:hypothetical protein